MIILELTVLCIERNIWSVSSINQLWKYSPFEKSICDVSIQEIYKINNVDTWYFKYNQKL